MAHALELPWGKWTLPRPETELSGLTGGFFTIELPGKPLILLHNLFFSCKYLVTIPHNINNSCISVFLKALFIIKKNDT